MGGGGRAARVDRAIRSSASAVRRLEKSLQAGSHGERAAAGRRAGDAIWADVREVGDRVDRGEFAASERASRTAARDAPGSVGEEAAAETDHQSPRGERVSAE